LLASALNVSWNAVARSISGKETFAWITALIGVVVLAPVFVWQRIDDPGALGARTQRFVVVSALIEVAYFLLLQASYRRADLSLVYPLSRGVSPIFAVVPARIWAGEALAAREYVGIAVIVGGAVVLAQSHPRGGDTGGEVAAGAVATRSVAPRVHGTRKGALLFILLTSVAIASYQLVDGIALRDTPPPRPLEYLFLMQVGLATLLTLQFVYSKARALRRGSASATDDVSLRRIFDESFAAFRLDLRRFLIAGVAIQTAYILILYSLREAKIPLVIAARGGAIPLSLIIGRFALQERITARRVAAALAIVAGVLLLVDWRR
jgi:uncharacterized membrane protein